MINGGLILIRESLNNVKPSEKNAALYILNHPEEVVHLPVKKLAKLSNSSESAVIRLCKNLGFHGFSDLKIRIAGDLQIALSMQNEYSEILPDDGKPTFTKALVNNHISSLRETVQLLDSQVIESAISCLIKAPKVDFYAVGASQLVAQDVQQKFSRIGKISTAYPDTHLQLTSAVNLHKGDVAVAISYSGETRQVISIAKEAKKTGATLITITKYGPNTLREYGDINIGIVAKEPDIRGAATSSRIVQLYIVDLLFTGIARANHDLAIKALEKSRKAIKVEFN